MSKDLDYEFNNFANLLHKDCMNLMECLKKQSEDNKPILYLGKHYEKVILPYEEYQKMCNRLESIDNANPSEALENLKYLKNLTKVKDVLNVPCWNESYEIVEKALLKAQEPKKYVDELKLVEKKLKALEIIKEKCVDIFRISYYITSNRINELEEYKRDRKLTEEEFNLLKEVEE